MLLNKCLLLLLYFWFVTYIIQSKFVWNVIKPNVNLIHWHNIIIYYIVCLWFIPWSETRYGQKHNNLSEPLKWGYGIQLMYPNSDECWNTLLGKVQHSSRMELQLTAVAAHLDPIIYLIVIYSLKQIILKLV